MGGVMKLHKAVRIYMPDGKRVCFSDGDTRRWKGFLAYTGMYRIVAVGCEEGAMAVHFALAR